MKWKRIIETLNETLEVRLQDGKPECSSSQDLSLEEAVGVVAVWGRSHEDPEVEAWLEAAEDEVDLVRRVDSRLWWDDLWGPPYETREEARTQAIRGREFERGEKAFTDRDYAKALLHLTPLAESGHPGAQFLLGRMCAKGAGMPSDNVAAYVWLDRAAKKNVKDAAEARRLVSERLSPSELAKALESTEGRCIEDANVRKRKWRVDLIYGCGTAVRPEPRHYYVEADSETAVRDALPEEVKRDSMWMVSISEV
jgi:TPR repeat protein